MNYFPDENSSYELFPKIVHNMNYSPDENSSYSCVHNFFCDSKLSGVLDLRIPPIIRIPPYYLQFCFKGGILKSFCPPQAENFGILGIGIYRNPFEFDHFGGPNRSQNEGKRCERVVKGVKNFRGA